MGHSETNGMGTDMFMVKTNEQRVNKTSRNAACSSLEILVYISYTFALYHAMYNAVFADPL